MSDRRANKSRDEIDTAPGDEYSHGGDVAQGVRGHLIGFAFTTLLSVASFQVLHSSYVWAPGVPVALIVFAIARMGVQLVVFLHINTGPDSNNNVMALALAC